MAMDDEQVERSISSIRKHADCRSKYYGRLLNWAEGKKWHYGIGPASRLAVVDITSEAFIWNELEVADIETI
jgi:hypothetical protein